MKKPSMKGCCSAPVILAIAAFLFAICPALDYGQSAAQATANPPTQAAPNAPVLVAKLVENLNTKSAKVGDPVTAKTVKELKLKEIDIPKGSKIMGTIAAVQSMQAGSGNSSLAIKFDHVELKDGKVLHVAGLITAIGAISNETGLGFNGVLGRGGVGSTNGLDPSLGAGGKTNDDIPPGSSLEGVALALHLDSNGASELRGVKRDIKLDSTVMVKVALYRGTA